MVCCHTLLLTQNLHCVAAGWARCDTPLVWIYAPVLPSDQWPGSGCAARQHQTKTQLWLRVSAAYKHTDGAAGRRAQSTWYPSQPGQYHLDILDLWSGRYLPDSSFR